MSLTKLFNFKFMKQMLKKAKGRVLIFLCIVPIFTVLTLMVQYADQSADVLDYGELCVINFLGMYVIPVILSINLFNYIYKRPSVDFINSMPISKKTIFLSNTLLGIVLIILMQIVNALGIFIFSAFNPNLIIFSQMVWDIFIIATVSYIFVFTVTNLAMCLSGNTITQIIVTALIVFFVPFFVNNFNNNMFNAITDDYRLDLGENFYTGNTIIYDEKLEEDLENKNTLTLSEVDAHSETSPYRMIKIVFGSYINLYNQKSINKMILLSIIYIALGSVLFKKRRFENLGESFQTVKVHEFVKALTMFPMIALINKLEILDQDIEIILLIYAIIIVYFIVYDIITSKKVNFKAGALSLVLTLVVLNVVTLSIDKTIRNRDAKFYSMNDVKSISVDLDGAREYNSKIMDYEITDRELIEEIFRARNTSLITIKIRMNDGKELYTNNWYSYYGKVDYKEGYIQTLLEKDPGYKEALIESKLTDGYYTLYNNINITDEYKDEIKNVVDDFQRKNINESNTWVNTVFCVRKYYYENHRIEEENYMIEDINFKNKIAEIYNKEFKEKLKNKLEEIEGESYYLSCSFMDYETGKDININLNDNKRIKDLLLNLDEKVDLNNNRYICCYSWLGSNKDSYFITTNQEILDFFDERSSKYDNEEYYYNKKIVVDTPVNTATNIVANISETTTNNIITNTVTNEVTNTVANKTN